MAISELYTPALDLSKASVTSYLPYKKGVYFPSTAEKEKISVGAERQRRYRTVRKLRTEPTEEHLWEVVLLYSGVRFKTYSGLPFSYNVRKGRNGEYTKELWIDRREKSSSILSILFDRYLYLGGAHGIPLRKSMVVNLNTGKPIKLHEILPVSFSELMDILRNQLYVRYGNEDTEILEVCYKNIADLYHEVDAFKFYIRYSALYIYFDVYEISSYSG